MDNRHERMLWTKFQQRKGAVGKMLWREAGEDHQMQEIEYNKFHDGMTYIIMPKL